MKDYYGQISGIDTGRMADVVAQVWSLLELAEGPPGVNTSGLTGFADSMRKMGDAGISGFTSAFYNCGDTVNKAVSSMLSTVSGAVLSNLPVTNGPWRRWSSRWRTLWTGRSRPSGHRHRI